MFNSIGYTIDLGLVRLGVVHTPGPGPVVVVRALILDHVLVLGLVVKVQEGVQSQPVDQDHKVNNIIYLFICLAK